MADSRRVHALAHRVAEGITGRPVLFRWLLAGPLTLIMTLLIMAGMSVWIPAGAARLNNIALPVILFPLIWAAVFFYAVLDDKLPRVAAVMTAAMLGHIVLIMIG